MKNKRYEKLRKEISKREREKKKVREKKKLKRGRRLRRLFLTLMELFLQLPDCYVRMVAEPLFKV